MKEMKEVTWAMEGGLCKAKAWNGASSYYLVEWWHKGKKQWQCKVELYVLGANAHLVLLLLSWNPCKYFWKFIGLYALALVIVYQSKISSFSLVIITSNA